MSSGGGQFDYTTDVQRLMDDLRDWLNGIDQTVTRNVSLMVQSYGVLCRELNDRLRRCQEYLRLNLWSAAIQLAEIEPNLVDRFTQLDFDGRADLDDRIAMYDQLETAPSLLKDIYEELNEAYDYHMPLERLFAKHRRLALKRSPLRSRLRVARSLSQQDTQAMFWEDDVIGFERDLIGEIKDEARKAASRGDAETLTQLKNELESPDWFELPPGKLIDGIETLIERARQQEFRQRLPELTESIRAQWDYFGRSFQDMEPVALAQNRNWQTLVSMLGEWFDDAEATGLLDSDPLFQQVSPIDEAVRNLESVIGQAEQQAVAIQRFRDGLRDNTEGRSRLETLHRDASQWGLLGSDLVAEYRRQMKSRWWKGNWERVLGVGLFLVLVIAAIVFAVVTKV